MKIYLYVIIFRNKINDKKEILRELLYNTATTIIEFEDNRAIDIYNIDREININYKLLDKNNFELLRDYNRIVKYNKERYNVYYIILTEEEDEEKILYEEMIDYVMNFDNVEVELDIKYYKEKNEKEVREELYYNNYCNINEFNRRWILIEEFVKKYIKLNEMEKYNYKQEYIKKLTDEYYNKFENKILL